MAIALRYAAHSDLGLLRDGNEDSGYAGPRLLVVADGVGGHAAGEVASSIAVAVLSALDEDSPGGELLEALASAVSNANSYLRDMVAGDPDLRGMSTTVTALLRAGSRFGLVHVGDSRCYLLRDGSLQQITHDHTFVQTLIDEGRITAEEADHHPQKSVITNALDGADSVKPDLSVREARLGDRYLLCSDGLSNVVSDKTLQETLAGGEDPDQTAHQLIELALRGGGPDNITVIVADVVDVDAGPSTTPVVVGAAAEGATRRTPGSSAAAKAAQLAPPPADDDGGDDEDLHYEEPQRHRARNTLLVLLLLVVLGAAGFGAWKWSQAQYYVGAAGENVAIYRGLTQDLGPISTSRVYQQQDIALSDLPDYQQDRVRSDITATSLGDAHRIVRTLRTQADVCRKQAEASASASASAATASPSASSKASASGKASAGSKASGSPTPTPSPTPSPSATGSPGPGSVDCGGTP
jgi:protein phosphatase